MKQPIITVSSQYKHLPGTPETDLSAREIKHGSALRNESFSFQVLYRAGCNNGPSHPISISLLCDGLPMEAYRVDTVPVTQAANLFDEPGYVGNHPGLYPDILSVRPAQCKIETVQGSSGNNYFETNTKNLLNALEDYQSLWITVNPNSEVLDGGNYSIKIRMTSLLSGEIMEEAVFSFEIIEALLPEQKAYYTNWIYEDSLCDSFGVDLYSKEFYQIFDDYVSNAVKHRQNTLLLPAFTPPLDTPVGKERRNVQLVMISKHDNVWYFGFDKMKEFIDHAKSCGIRYFEHSHLFSQWGAEHAPNIYDTDNNRIFGAETDATGEEYQTFLHAYLKAFLRFAKDKKIENTLVFHISDEPAMKHFDAYKSAVESVKDILSDYPLADALSHMEYYREGLVKQPVAFIDRAEEFEAVGAPFWVYYTGGPHHRRATNRLITNSAARTRVLGLQMYRYNALGFLHWGYNYYYDRLSNGLFEPRSNPCGYKQYPGAAHLVYPVYGNTECHVAPSIREKHMAEAIDDLRALRLLEQSIGREKVLALCEDILQAPINNKLIPAGDQLYTLREKVNQAIKFHL
ncbi:MAG: DUF4091 domain-containing protein [Clostridia bacterium]|nr:DUF4091 domain-containing protein [Clostridia bacterium]